MNEEAKYISIRRASEICGLCPQTLRSLAAEDKIEHYKTPSGQRRFNRIAVEKMCNVNYVDGKPFEIKRENFIYARVSSKKQQDDLVRQLEYIKSKDTKYLTYTLIQDIGSGINFKKRGLQTILDACVKKSIGEIVVAHRDRLCRFGFDLVKSIVEKSGGIITVIDDEQHKSSEQELSEDLLSIVQIYSCKQMGKRRYTIKKSENQDKTIERPNDNIERLVQNM